MPDTRWTGFETDRALAWCHVFFDFPPSFPSAVVMSLAYRAFRNGKPPGIGWARFARTAEEMGFDPDLYYLFRLALRDIPFGKKFASNVQITAPEDLAPWALWPELLRSGTTPLIAISMIAHPTWMTRGMVMDATGTVVLSSDD